MVALGTKGVGEGVDVIVGGTGDGMIVAVAGIGDDVNVTAGGSGVETGSGEHPAIRTSNKIKARCCFMVLPPWKITKFNSTSRQGDYGSSDSSK
jgi:hypothetical protein